MATSTLSQRFVDIMWPRVKAFQSSVSSLDTSGIPEPHLPVWGNAYEGALPRLGIIGRDTRGWGDMPQFLEAMGEGPDSALFRSEAEFHSLDFTGWTNNFGTSFWDASIQIIAGVHGISDWKHLKRQILVEPLQGFFWANVNSVEKYEVSPKKNGVARGTWEKVKRASEEHLDSFRSILDIFQPDAVFIMNWNASKHFLDFSLEWTEFGDHLTEAVDPKTGCLVLATAHPTWLNQNKLYKEAIEGLIKRANRSLHRAPLRGADGL